MRTALFGIARREATFAHRGFEAGAPGARERLESVGVAFVDGYDAWLSCRLDETLAQLASELHGFAVEGAAMASALLDHMTPWRRHRWGQLLRERPEHSYMIHVGAGWATARMHGSLRRAVRARDPLLGWLVADGWGFHQTYFHAKRWATGRARFPVRTGYLSRAVDQGIGRALWFVAGADPARLVQQIERFVPARHGDLWSGVGLAATYAGGCPPRDLTALVLHAGERRAQLAQGAAFAATCRTLAGNATAHTDATALAITGRKASELDRLATALKPVEPYNEHSYEAWRVGLAEALATRKAA